jgi:hypothetical protein
MSQQPGSISNGILKKRTVLNRRVWVRYPFAADTPSQLFNTASSKVLQAVVQNLSSGGIALLLCEALQPATVLKVEVEGGDGPRLLVARVTHVTEQAEGWLHGCELTVPLTADQIENLLTDDKR